MRKMRVLVTLFCVLVFAAGCQNHAEYQEETVIGNFEFDIPDAYTMSEIADNSCTVYKETNAIGGIVFTNLNNGKIADIDKIELRKYLDSFAPSPLTYEYVAMYFSDNFDYVAINFVVTEPETDEKTYYHHYLFEKGDGCYDLWLMDEFVDENEQNELLVSVCN